MVCEIRTLPSHDLIRDAVAFAECLIEIPHVQMQLSQH
jgi:hypothetical protein